jgi:hypothetical protein
MRSNLTSSAANSLVVDPQDANTAYLATDAGVYLTRNAASCGNASSACWSPLGSGLPAAPVVALSAAPATTTPSVLAAATYGRGVWQIPLATASVQLTSATLDPASIDFGAQPEGSASSIQTATLANTGGIALAPTATAIGGANAGDFTIASDRCTGKQLNSGATCDVELVFAPGALGDRSAALSVSANVQGGQLSTALAGKGLAPGNIKLTPTVLNFDNALSGPTAVGTTSKPLSITVENSGGTAVPVTSATVSGPFVLANNVCATTSIAANSDCQLTIKFQPATPGPATGALTLIDGAGTQTVVLTGTGAAPPTDTLSTMSLSFPPTVIGQSSAPLTVGISNTGDLPLTSIAVAATGLSGIQQLHHETGCQLELFHQRGFHAHPAWPPERHPDGFGHYQPGAERVPERERGASSREWKGPDRAGPGEFPDNRRRHVQQPGYPDDHEFRRRGGAHRAKPLGFPRIQARE